MEVQYIMLNSYNEIPCISKVKTVKYITVWDTEKTWGRGYNLAEGVRLGKTFLRQRLEV